MILCNGADSMKAAAGKLARRVLEAMGHIVVGDGDDPQFTCVFCGAIYDVTGSLARIGERPSAVWALSREGGELASCAIEREVREGTFDHGYSGEVSRR